MLIVFHCGRCARPVLDRIGDQPHRGRGREDELLLRGVLLEDVVLQRPAQLIHRHALFLGGGDVERPQDRRRAVDGHAGRDFAQRDAVEQNFHVLERTDGDAALAELAQRFGRVGVVAHQRSEVEGDRQAGVALLDQVLVTGVGLLRRAEPGEHPHRPQPTALPGRVNAARERVLAGKAEVGEVVDIGDVQRRVQPLDRDARLRHEFLLLATLRHPLEGRIERLFAPRLPRGNQLIFVKSHFSRSCAYIDYNRMRKSSIRHDSNRSLTQVSSHTLKG